MGKYIVEMESGTHIFVLGPEGIVHIGEPDVVYGTVDGMQIGDAVINAKPYTEPDLEQVKAKAYKEGFKDGQYAERNGLVANYEQKQEEIKVGDVVYHVECPDIKLWVVDVDHNKIAGIALKDVDGSCDKGDLFKEQPIINYAKTGQHFEIATILEKMRGEQDG